MKNLELKNLVERGYFPKELPPPFNTSQLANKVDEVTLCWDTIYSDNTNLDKIDGEPRKKYRARKREYANNFTNSYKSSKNVCFSIPNGNLSRRFLGVPNPKHFIALSRKIVDNWESIQKIFQKSKYSTSFPVSEVDPPKRSVSTYSKNVDDFKKTRLEASFSKLIEVRVDISKFYPSIYTHSITWAFLGKEQAKKYYNNKNSLIKFIEEGDQEAFLYKTADEIDSCLQSCQDRQSIGIPIGPDTSHIIAEVIACRIDNLLDEKFKDDIDLKGCRYYDDYYLFVSTKDQTDRVLKGLQKILTDFQLQINEAKVTIKEFPFSFEDDFVIILSQFDFKDKDTTDTTSIGRRIKYYFSIIWELAAKAGAKSDTVFKYALRTFERRTVEIPKKDWKLFENLLLKTALFQPAILDIVTRIMLSYQNYLDQDSKNKLKEVIEQTIKNHSEMGHDFEVSWALWLAKTFAIDIEENIIKYVLEMKNPVSLLILLDLTKTTQLVKGEVDFSGIEQELNNSTSLFSEYWLLAYEGVKKGWLTIDNENFLEENHFFKILKDLDIEFYDSSKQLDIVESKVKSTQKKTKENQQKIDINDVIDTGEYTVTSSPKDIKDKKETEEKTNINTQDIIFAIPSNLY